MIKHSSKFGELTKDNKIGIIIFFITILVLVIIGAIVVVPKILAKHDIKDIPIATLNIKTIDVLPVDVTKNQIVPTNLKLNPVPPPQVAPLTSTQIPSPIVSPPPAVPGTIICGVNNFSEIYSASQNIVGTGLPNWLKVPGSAKMIEVNINGSMYAVNSNSQIWYILNSTASIWTSIAGALSTISSNGTQLCGTNKAGDIWYTSEGTKGVGIPVWNKIRSGGWNPTNQVIANGDGSIYACQMNKSVWYSPNILAVDDKTKTPNLVWTQLINTYCDFIAYNSTTLMCIYMGILYYANQNIKGKDNPNWVIIPLPNKLMIINISLNLDGTMYIILSDNTIWYGINTYSNPSWKQIPGTLSQISSNK